MSSPIIQLADVSFAYNGHHALDHINLEVNPGDYLGLIGPNGGGKTTLLKLMLGLLEPQMGTVKLFGQDIRQFRDWSKIGYVPQKATNIDAKFPITVEEVVALGRLSRVGMMRRFQNADRAAINSALAGVGIEPLRKRPLSELSGGQQQRVFIAKALVSEPEILFLDEPTVGVDTHSQDEFYQLLSDLNQNFGLTLVMVSHDIDVIVNEVTKLASVNETLVYFGQPKDFIKDDYVTKLYGKARKFILHGQ